MHKMLNQTAAIAVGVLTAAAGLGLWTTPPAAHAATNDAAISICVDPTLNNVGDLCCDGKGTVTLFGNDLVCL
ncbi:MAG TPA: hypothetical protein VF053_18490 [Streptosporangiales bacterium]